MKRLFLAVAALCALLAVAPTQALAASVTIREIKNIDGSSTLAVTEPFDGEYSWQKFDGGEWTEVAATRTLVLRDDSDSGTYRCVITDGEETFRSNELEVIKSAFTEDTGESGGNGCEKFGWVWLLAVLLPVVACVAAIFISSLKKFRNSADGNTDTEIVPKGGDADTEAGGETSGSQSDPNDSGSLPDSDEIGNLREDAGGEPTNGDGANDDKDKAAGGISE